MGGGTNGGLNEPATELNGQAEARPAPTKGEVKTVAGLTFLLGGTGTARTVGGIACAASRLPGGRGGDENTALRSQTKEP